MATTEYAIVDRIRTVLDGLGYTEATGPTFALSPGGVIDGSYIVAFTEETPSGHIGMQEEARGIVTVQVARVLGNDHIVARRTALDDARDVINAVIRDGALTSGEYAVEDAGRAVDVTAPVGASYLIGRARIPINFEVLIT